MEDWETNIKAIRVKRKDLEKLSESYKVDCFQISSTPFKVSADDLLGNLAESMTDALRNSLRKDCEMVEEFIKAALDKLQKKPSTMEEMSQAKDDYFELKGKKKDMQRQLEGAEVKNKLLRNLVGLAFNIDNTKKRWENFEVAIGDFDSILSQQTEQIKTDIVQRSKNVDTEIERFHSKWQSLRPKQLEELDRESARELATKMKEWRTEWNEIEKRAKDVERDSEHFDMTPPKFSHLGEVRDELTSHESTWGLFDEFNEELGAFE